MKKLTLLLLLVSLACCASDLYPPNTNFSFKGLENWSQPRIASGTAIPPVASASEGDLFINKLAPTAPTLSVKSGGAWRILASGAGGSVSTQRLVASDSGSLFSLSLVIENPANTSLSVNGLDGTYPDNYEFVGSSTLDLGTPVPSGTVLIFRKFN